MSEATTVTEAKNRMARTASSLRRLADVLCRLDPRQMSSDDTETYFKKAAAVLRVSADAHLENLDALANLNARVEDFDRIRQSMADTIAEIERDRAGKPAA